MTEARFARESWRDKRTHCVRRADGGERGTRGGRQGSRFLRKGANPSVIAPASADSRSPPCT